MVGHLNSWARERSFYLSFLPVADTGLATCWARPDKIAPVFPFWYFCLPDHIGCRVVDHMKYICRGRRSLLSVWKMIIQYNFILNILMILKGWTTKLLLLHSTFPEVWEDIDVFQNWLQVKIWSQFEHWNLPSGQQNNYMIEFKCIFRCASISST